MGFEEGNITDERIVCTIISKYDNEYFITGFSENNSPIYLAQSNNFTHSLDEKKNIELHLESNFEILPKPFLKTPTLCEENTTESHLTDDNILRFTSGIKTSRHLAEALYKWGVVINTESQFYTVGIILSNHILVFCFEQNKCYFSNVFPLENEAECLYFLTAQSKAKNIAESEAKYYILSSQEMVEKFKTSSEKFIKNISYLPVQMPSKVQKNPVFVMQHFFAELCV